MRIQEMRSGIAHLKKRMNDDREGTATASALDDDPSQAEIETVVSRLDQPAWSVVSFNRLEAGGMTYAQAEELMAALDDQDVSGLCIVTDEAASRMAG